MGCLSWLTPCIAYKGPGQGKLVQCRPLEGPYNETDEKLSYISRAPPASLHKAALSNSPRWLKEDRSAESNLYRRVPLRDSKNGTGIPFQKGKDSFQKGNNRDA